MESVDYSPMDESKFLTRKFEEVRESLLREGEGSIQRLSSQPACMIAWAAPPPG